MPAEQLRVACPACGAKFTAPSWYAGKTAKCAKCGEKFTVPSGFAVEVKTSPVPATLPDPEPDEFAFNVPSETGANDDPIPPASARTSTPPAVPSMSNGQQVASWWNQPVTGSEPFLMLRTYLFVCHAVLACTAAIFLTISLIALVAGIFMVKPQGYIALGVSGVLGLSAIYLYVVGMAGVELIRVFMAIEKNTRKS